jgi:hypothetical protein
MRDLHFAFVSVLQPGVQHLENALLSLRVRVRVHVQDTFF